MTLYVALLFILLTPGVLLRLPPKGSLLTVAIVHGLVFALVFHFTRKIVYRLSVDGFEGEMGIPKKEEEEKLPGM
jgi:hypothetical protein